MRLCENCRIELTVGMVYCDVCASMIVAINLQPGLVKAQMDWLKENEERAKLKQRILSGEER
jgi:hypothetical protein